MSGQPLLKSSTLHISMVARFSDRWLLATTSLNEFNKHASNNSAIDREIDTQLRQIVERFCNISDTEDSPESEVTTGLELDVDLQADVLILESRLAGWIAGPDATLRIWCCAPLETRVKRINETDSRDETEAEVIERQRDEAMRYEEWYNVNITDTSIYDLSINTARWKPTAIATVVTCAVEAYIPDPDGRLGQREYNSRLPWVDDSENRGRSAVLPIACRNSSLFIGLIETLSNRLLNPLLSLSIDLLNHFSADLVLSGQIHNVGSLGKNPEQDANLEIQISVHKWIVDCSVENVLSQMLFVAYLGHIGLSFDATFLEVSNCLFVLVQVSSIVIS